MNEAVHIYEFLTELSMDYNICFYVEALPLIDQRRIVIYDKEDRTHFADCKIPEVIFSDDNVEEFKLYIDSTLWVFGIDLDEEDSNVNKT